MLEAKRWIRVRKLEEMSEQVSGVVGTDRENLNMSIADLKTAVARLDNTLDSAEKVMARIDRGEGTLGKLVNDNMVSPPPKPSTGSTGTSGSTTRCG